MTRICSRCRNTHNRAGRYCHTCHAGYMRAWRAERVYVRRDAIGGKRQQAMARPE